MNTIPNAETVRFDDGDHLTITPARGHVTITGLFGGEDVTLDLLADAALDQGFLLCQYAPDALWTLAPARSERIGNAMIAAATLAQWETPGAPNRDADGSVRVPDSGDASESTDDRSPCPPWCSDYAWQDHWMRRSGGNGELWEVIHTQRFGPVAVYVPEEVYDDGTRWVGAPEAVIHHDDHTQQIVGESALTIAEAAELAGQLHSASQFATDLAARIESYIADGTLLPNGRV